ncbi:MAG: tyrosine--tRNA ligase [bacterium]
MNKFDNKKIKDLMTRGVVDVIVKKNLEEKLRSGKKLRVKYGIDPTGPKIHLGRASTMRKLAKFQELGHQVVLIVGDFTAQIGDASDKMNERPMLTDLQVKENMKNYLPQIGKIIDVEKAEVRYNSEWLGKLSYADICRQADNFSVAQILDRENFSKRIKEGTRISLRELLYPLMQGYDSVAINTDIEIGGSDQLFNVLAGRELQRAYGQDAQNIITFKLLDGTDGRKMSTSWGNIICITDDADSIYGKIMSMRDELITQYFELCTDVEMEKIKEMEAEISKNKINPRDLKMWLAREIVKIYYDGTSALVAEENFKNVFQKKEIPDKVESFFTKIKKYSILDLVVDCGFAKSKGEARRLVLQKGIKIDGKTVDASAKVIEITEKGILLQKGKRSFIKVKIK